MFFKVGINPWRGCYSHMIKTIERRRRLSRCSSAYLSDAKDALKLDTRSFIELKTCHMTFTNGFNPLRQVEIDFDASTGAFEARLVDIVAGNPHLPIEVL